MTQDRVSSLTSLEIHRFEIKLLPSYRKHFHWINLVDNHSVQTLTWKQKQTKYDDYPTSKITEKAVQNSVFLLYSIVY